MHPPEIGEGTQQVKEWHVRKLLGRQRADATVAFDNSLLDGVERVSSAKKQRNGREVEEVPSETGVIEVQQLNSILAQQEIVRKKVGMDQAVGLRRPPIDAQVV